MSNFLLVEIVNALNHLLEQHPGITFAETAGLVKSVEKFSPVAETELTYFLLSDYVDAVVVLEYLVDLDDVGVVKGDRDLDLVHEHVEIFDLCLLDFFDSPPGTLGTSDSALVDDSKSPLAQFLANALLTLAMTS